MRKLSACAKRGGRCHLSRPKGIGVRCIPQLIALIRVGGVRPGDERSRLDLSRPNAFRSAFFSGQCIEATRLRNLLHREQIRSTRLEELRKLQKLRKGSSRFRDEKRQHMVGFISNLAPLLSYLRRRSPGPPFPPDHRQAGERGAKNLRRRK